MMPKTSRRFNRSMARTSTSRFWIAPVASFMARSLPRLRNAAPIGLPAPRNCSARRAAWAASSPGKTTGGSLSFVARACSRLSSSGSCWSSWQPSSRVPSPTRYSDRSIGSLHWPSRSKAAISQNASTHGVTMSSRACARASIGCSTASRRVLKPSAASVRSRVRPGRAARSHRRLCSRRQGASGR